MQFPGNTALAAALATGQKRLFRFKLMFDWNRNGLFADANSDLSANIISGKRNKQLVGDFPEQMQIQSGKSAAQLTFTLGGSSPDGTPLWQLLAPNAASKYAFGGSVNVPMYFSVLVYAPQTLSWIEVRQFTGYLRNAKPARKSGEVQIQCLDAASQLENPITLYRWAVDEYMRNTYLASGLGSNPPVHAEYAQSGCINGDWLIDHILRRSGYYQAPQWHPNTILGWTMRGAALPEIGAINQDCTRGWNGFLSPVGGVNVHNLSQWFPAGLPQDTMESAGGYGYTFKGKGKLPLFLGNRFYSAMDGTAYATTNIRPQIRSYGSANSNILTFSTLVKVDSTLTSGATSYSTFYIDPPISYRYNCTAQWDHTTGQVKLGVTNINDSSDIWRWTSTTNMTPGWHFLTCILIFTSGNIQAYIKSDGTDIIAPGGTGGRPGVPLPAVSTGYPDGATHPAIIHAEGPVQVCAWNYQHNTSAVAYTFPPSAPPTDVRQQARVDLTYQRFTWLPDIQQKAAWDILSDITDVDFGALYVDEFGTPCYDWRAHIMGKRTTANIAETLTQDQVYDLNPSASFDSIATIIQWTERDVYSSTFETIYQTTKSDQFQIQSGVTFQPTVTLNDVQAINTGNVPWWPRAQGYDPPGTLSTYWRDFMSFYSPDYYPEGFTAYPPGSRTDPSQAPYQGTGLDVILVPGWATGDQDPRHMRLTLVNSNSSGTLEYAVDDSRPFLKGGGTLLIDQGSATKSVSDAASIQLYGQRVYTIPQSDWAQDGIANQAIFNIILQDVKKPQVYLASVDLPGDPRRQLQDIIQTTDPGGFGTVNAMSVGIDTTYEGGEDAKVTDTLVLRTF